MTTNLKSVRAGHRSVVSRILRRYDERKDSEGDLDTEELETILHSLTEKLDVLKELDGKILEQTQEDDVERELIDADEYNFNLDPKVRKIRKHLQAKTSTLSASAKSFTAVHATTQPHQQAGSAHDVSHNSQVPDFRSSSIQSTTSNSSNATHKLPKLNLPTFNGNILDWNSFWDSFDTAVHSNTSLSEVQKFNYLKSLLEGEASYTIAGFSLTHANYNNAVELLHERFGQEHMIVQSYIQAILELPAPKNTLASMKSYYDRTESYIRGLESLGHTQESYGSVLVPVILNKMPGEIRKNLTREHGSTNWMLSALRKAILKELTILQSERGIESQENPVATAAFYTHAKNRNRAPPKMKSPQKRANAVICAYCKDSHYSADCTKYTDSASRMKIVKKDRLCFNCLGKHSVAECKSRSNCRNCNRRHHTSLCNKDEDREKEKTTTSTCTLQAGNTDETDTTILHSSGSAYRNRPMVLLKTAIAPVKYRGQTTDVNILFDEGAQRSFVSRKLASKLKLNPSGSEAITLTGFGDSGSSNYVQHLDTATIKLQTLEKKEIPLNVLIVPEIAAPLKTCVGPATKLPYLNNLRLAHTGTDEDAFEIELLIGVDQYWNIVEDKTVRGEGPVAVKSKIGYLLSGPIKGSKIINAKTSMMNVIVSHKMEEFDLERFWRLETIGTENTDSESAVKQDFVETYGKTSIRNDDNKYYVKLPWKEEHQPLPTNRKVAYRRTLNVVNSLKKDQIC